MRPLSESTARVSAKNFQRKYISLGRIAKHWREIMGEKMADKAHPARLYYRKPKKKGEPPRTVLYIAASDSHAATLHYQKDLILERINHIFGERWIADIKFTAASDIQPLAAPNKRRAPSTISADDSAALNDSINHVDDDEIQAILRRLGEGILQKAPKK